MEIQDSGSGGTLDIMANKKWRRDYGEGHNLDDNETTGVERSSPPRNNGSSMKMKGVKKSSWPILFLLPNILGYIRIILSFYGFRSALQNQPRQAVNIWIAAALLDLFDGAAARMLNQCSQLGTVLDVVADNILRTVVWIAAMIEVKSYTPTNENEICCWAAVICLEWITFFCSQNNQMTQKGDRHIHWKDFDVKRAPPPWVHAVFKNNFRSIPGALAIYGLFVSPFGTYIWYSDRLQKSSWPSQLLSERDMSMLIKISYAGRLLSASVEVWLCCEYVRGVIARERRQI